MYIVYIHHHQCWDMFITTKSNSLFTGHSYKWKCIACRLYVSVCSPTQYFEGPFLLWDASVLPLLQKNTELYECTTFYLCNHHVTDIGLFLLFSYHKCCCYKYSCTPFCVWTCCHFSWISRYLGEKLLDYMATIFKLLRHY